MGLDVFVAAFVPAWYVHLAYVKPLYYKARSFFTHAAWATLMRGGGFAQLLTLCYQAAGRGVVAEHALPVARCAHPDAWEVTGKWIAHLLTPSCGSAKAHMPKVYGILQRGGSRVVVQGALQEPAGHAPRHRWQAGGSSGAPLQGV